MTVMLYKYPGPHKLGCGDFDYCVVDDDKVDSAIKDGWSLTTTEAKADTPKRKRRTKAEMKAAKHDVD